MGSDSASSAQLSPGAIDETTVALLSGRDLGGGDEPTMPTARHILSSKCPLFFHCFISSCHPSSMPVAIPSIFPAEKETSNASMVSASFSPTCCPSLNPICLACSTHSLSLSFAITSTYITCAAPHPISYAVFHSRRIVIVLLPALV
ncbi:hypothetical protein K438DRAFT_1841349 [Mycena galopus ATCC 62051]|nr:hypothetical protein K438DRAFT_1841349 [Mycena galopus ATCC 62051]